MMDVSIEIVTDEQRQRPDNSEVDRLFSDSTSIFGATSWSPRHSLSDGLAATIEWFRQPQNLARYKTDHYNV